MARPSTVTGLRERRAEGPRMRVVIVGLVLFALLYAVVTVVDARNHSSPASTAPSRPSLPAVASNSWDFTPAFLKVDSGTVAVYGASKAGSVVTLTPNVAATLAIPPSSAWYQPARLMRLTFQNPASLHQVQLAYPPIASPTQSGTPDPLTASQPHTLIVLPKAGGAVQLTCQGFGACAVSI